MALTQCGRVLATAEAVEKNEAGGDKATTLEENELLRHAFPAVKVKATVRG